MGALMIGFLLLPGRGEREREKNEQLSLFCPHGDELHDIEKLFIEYAWVFYTKAAAPRDAAQRAPGGRRLGGLEPSGPPTQAELPVLRVATTFQRSSVQPTLAISESISSVHISICTY